jgi:glycosyltransferase involved in cell wall biosynthesis
MRILIAIDGFGDAGGVQTYLDAVVPVLAARHHQSAVVHLSSGAFHQSNGLAAALSISPISVAERGVDGALAEIRRWAPDVCFSHNMRDLDLERRLMDVSPVVKFMHGYFGTCVGGQKMRRFPVVAPCDRTFGPACLALYLPCGCGQRDPAAMLRQYFWASRQHSLLTAYAAIVVASAHMKHEFVRHGVAAERVHVTPLFAPLQRDAVSPPASATVAFCGRMTRLKGGHLLIEAAAMAARALGRPVALSMIGDGPQRAEWEQLASRLGVRARFTGWLTGETLWAELGGATLLAMPSTWPEPFGLSGLEAGALGVPAIAFDVGGVREWLRPGENGYLVPGDPPCASALAGVLADALTDPATMTMRTSARRLAVEMSLERHVDRLEGLLRAQEAAVVR